MFNVDTFNGTFVFNTCCQCRREWECYRIESNFVCEECENAQPDDGEQASDRDQN